MARVGRPQERHRQALAVGMVIGDQRDRASGLQHRLQAPGLAYGNHLHAAAGANPAAVLVKLRVAVGQIYGTASDPVEPQEHRKQVKRPIVGSQQDGRLAAPLGIEHAAQEGIGQLAAVACVRPAVQVAVGEVQVGEIPDAVHKSVAGDLGDALGGNSVAECRPGLSLAAQADWVEHAVEHAGQQSGKRVGQPRAEHGKVHHQHAAMQVAEIDQNAGNEILHEGASIGPAEPGDNHLAACICSRVACRWPHALAPL
jgi:hypothetical protein